MYVYLNSDSLHFIFILFNLYYYYIYIYSLYIIHQVGQNLIYENNDKFFSMTESINRFKDRNLPFATTAQKLVHHFFSSLYWTLNIRRETTKLLHFLEFSSCKSNKLKNQWNVERKIKKIKGRLRSSNHET